MKVNKEGVFYIRYNQKINNLKVSLSNMSKLKSLSNLCDIYNQLKFKSVWENQWLLKPTVIMMSVITNTQLLTISLFNYWLPFERLQISWFTDRIGLFEIKISVYREVTSLLYNSSKYRTPKHQSILGYCDMGLQRVWTRPYNFFAAPGINLEFWWPKWYHNFNWLNQKYFL